MLVSERFPAERVVMVALVKVALPPAIFAVVIFAVAMLEVVELVVEALDVAKLAVVPHSVVIVARVEVKVLTYPVTADSIPVIEVLEIVVDPRVEDPVTRRFAVVEVAETN